MSQIKDIEWHEVDATTLVVGQQFQITEDDEDFTPFIGDMFTVVSISPNDAHDSLLEIETHSQDFTFGDGDRVLVQLGISNG